MITLDELADALRSHGVQATESPCGFTVSIDREDFAVSLTEGEAWDEPDDRPMEDQTRPERIGDHFDVLDAMLCYLSRSTHREKIAGLTEDGSRDDCEAIFTYDGTPMVLSVR